MSTSTTSTNTHVTKEKTNKASNNNRDFNDKSVKNGKTCVDSSGSTLRFHKVLIYLAPTLSFREKLYKFCTKARSGWKKILKKIFTVVEKENKIQGKIHTLINGVDHILPLLYQSRLKM